MGDGDSTPPVLTLKFKTQVDRLEALQELGELISECAPNITVEELRVYSAQIKETHQAFLRDHNALETSWPTELLDHEYVTSKMFQREAKCVFKLKLWISRILEELQSYQPRTSRDSPQPQRRQRLHLPHFNGDYLLWPTFKDQFSAMVIANDQLTDEDRLRYLIESLGVEPTQLITKLPITDSSFKSVWDLLVTRYENKRLIIKSHLDRLFSIPPVTSASATELKQLLTTVDHITRALTSLGKVDETWNWFLVYQVTHCLNRSTRELWERSLTSTTEYPQYQRLEAFIRQQIRALEGATRPPSTSSAAPSTRAYQCRAKSSLKHASARSVAYSSRSSTTYPCDYCHEEHFVVMCPEFRRMTVPQRRAFITTHALCRNCCGRHSAANCKSRLRCKECQAAHHTMLHLAAVSSQRFQPKPEGSGK